MTPARRDLPRGTVTFLFTDIEGSTQLLHELGPAGYADALAEHRRIVRDDVPETLTELEREHDNIRAALDTFETTGDGTSALRLGSAIWPFWRAGHAAEGRRRLDRALVIERERTIVRGVALAAAAEAAAVCGDLPMAESLAEESLAIHREQGNALGEAQALHTLGFAVGSAGGWERARALFRESARIYVETGDEASAAWSTRSLAWTEKELGNIAAARELHEANLLRARRIKSPSLEAISLATLGMIAVDEGAIDDARGLFRASLPILHELGDKLEIATNLGRIARALAAAGDHLLAARLVACSMTMCEEMGTNEPWVTKMNAGTLETVTQALPEKELTRALSTGHAMSAEEGMKVAEAGLA